MKDLLSVLLLVFVQLKLGTTMPGLPEGKSRVTVQRAETKEAPGELGSVGLLLLCGEDAVFSGGIKQLDKQLWGSLFGWGYPKGHMGNKQHLLQSRTESPELAVLPKKASDKHQPQWAETAEPRGMAQPEPGAFWWFITLVLMSGWRHPTEELSICTNYTCTPPLLSPIWRRLVCVAHQPLTEVTPYINCCETSSSKMFQKIIFFKEQPGMGEGFFQNFVARRKEEALSSSGLDIETI